MNFFFQQLAGLHPKIRRQTGGSQNAVVQKMYRSHQLTGIFSVLCVTGSQDCLLEKEILTLLDKIIKEKKLSLGSLLLPYCKGIV